LIRDEMRVSIKTGKLFLQEFKFLERANIIQFTSSCSTIIIHGMEYEAVDSGYYKKTLACKYITLFMKTVRIICVTFISIKEMSE
jgi:hypothetical protein